MVDIDISIKHKSYFGLAYHVYVLCTPLCIVFNFIKCYHCKFVEGTDFIISKIPAHPS